MSKVLSRLVVLALAVAVVVVPTIARAQQQVERRDATRLSIKHSWVGVAPPSKTTMASQQVVALPAVATAPALPRVTERRAIVAETSVRRLVLLAPDPLRGPPSLS